MSRRFFFSEGLKGQPLGDLDVAIDGADEVDPALNLVKGGGLGILGKSFF